MKNKIIKKMLGIITLSLALTGAFAENIAENTTESTNENLNKNATETKNTNENSTENTTTANTTENISDNLSNTTENLNNPTENLSNNPNKNLPIKPSSPQDNENKGNFFDYSGNVSTFNKFGFKGGKPNGDSTPTESFTTIFGKVDTIYDFKPYIHSDAIKVFKIGLGMGANGLAYDSTKKDGERGGVYSSGSGLNRNYVGAWYGNGKVGGSGGGERNFMLHNAFIDFQSTYFDLKGGRYESDKDYHSGYTQGFSADLHFNPTSNDELKFWWFSSWGRALADSQWFLDFYAVRLGADDKNTGIHSGGMDYKHDLIVENNGIKSGASVLFRPWTQFYAGLFNASGGKLEYHQYFGNGYGIRLSAQGYALNLVGNKEVIDSGLEGDRVDKLSGNLNAILKVFMFDYNVRLGVYKNFGSAGYHIGTYGNPIGIDQWTGSVYDNDSGGDENSAKDKAHALNNITARNALTAYLSGGGAHNFEIGTFKWEILARYTTAPSSDESSVALLLRQIFKLGFALGLKVEWLNDKDKVNKRTDDRSHAFVMLDYNF